MEGLFVATPPLETLRSLVSDAATDNTGGKVMMVIYVSRTFFTR